LTNILLLEPTIYISHGSLNDTLGSMDLWYCVAQLVESALPSGTADLISCRRMYLWGKLQAETTNRAGIPGLP